MNGIIYNGKKGYLAENEAFYSVEVYFSEIPDITIRETMKALGWRYNNQKRCWYNRKNEENLGTAKALVGELENTLSSYDQIIGVEDLIVVTSMLSCIHKKHTLKTATALFSVLLAGRIREVIGTVYYCAECDVYYMLEHDFREIKDRGNLCCRVITIEEYRKLTGEEYALAPISIMRSYGYTVNANDSLSIARRHEILSYLVENDIISAERIAEYLSWFIRRADGMPHMVNAIRKWQDDRDFIMGYSRSNIYIRVRSVFIKKRRYTN